MKFPPPSLTPPSLAEWQYSYLGLTFGVNAGGISVLKVEGLDLPAIRAADMTRARNQGELVGYDLYPGRDIIMDLFLQTDGTSLIQAQANLASITQAQGSTEQPLWFQIPNMEVLCVMCRPRGRVMPWDFNYSAANYGEPTVSFHATYPYIWGQGQLATVGLNPPTGDLTFPVTFPVTFGTTAPNSTIVTNGGNVPMNPVLVIDGPCTNPSVMNGSLTGAPSITISNPTQTSYTVDSGDQIVVDMDARSITYYVGGVSSGSMGASRSSWLVSGSTWWGLNAGNNEIQYTSSDSLATGSSCQIWWANAWLL